MRLQWKPSLETPDVTYHEVTDEARGIMVVVECDDSAGSQPWWWYLANYPVVSREPADNEGPAGRASTRESAVEEAAKAFPTLTETADLKRKEEELCESEQ